MDTRRGTDSYSDADAASTDTEFCSICVGGLSKTRIVTECGHVFCATCLVLWWRINETCPMCRSSMPQFPQHLEHDRHVHDDIDAVLLAQNVLNAQMLETIRKVSLIFGTCLYVVGHVVRLFTISRFVHFVATDILHLFKIIM